MKKQSYQSAKKRITSELANVLKDPSVVIVSDWLKVRGTLRDWTKLWAILKPGLMLLYRNSPSKVDSFSTCIKKRYFTFCRMVSGSERSFYHHAKVSYCFDLIVHFFFFPFVVIQRPSKKPGFCFKIWHPLEKSIWAQKGPNNEQFGAITFPLPMNYLIFRATDDTAGK